MKRIMTMLTLMLALLTTVAVAQNKENKFRIAAGYAEEDLRHVTLELGGKFKNNVVSAVADRYINGYDVEQICIGMKYQHYFPIVHGKWSAVDLVAGASYTIRDGNKKKYLFEPQAGIQINPFRNVGVLLYATSPIAKGAALDRPLRFSSGAQLVVTL